MHPCGLGLKPASIIIVLWYCRLSIFSPLRLPLLSTRSRKECKNWFPFKRERKTRFFSQGVELEDSAFSSYRWGLFRGYHEKQSCSKWGESVGNYTSYCHWFWGNLWLGIILHVWLLLSYIWQKIYENCLLSDRISVCYLHYWQVITGVGPDRGHVQTDINNASKVQPAQLF